MEYSSFDLMTGYPELVASRINTLTSLESIKELPIKPNYSEKDIHALLNCNIRRMRENEESTQKQDEKQSQAESCGFTSSSQSCCVAICQPEEKLTCPELCHAPGCVLRDHLLQHANIKSRAMIKKQRHQQINLPLMS